MPRVTRPPPAPPRLVVLALDAAWDRTGWAICDADGPLVFGDARPDGEWRHAKAAALFRELRAEAQELAIGRDADPILVVERCGTHYSWQAPKRGKDDQRGADPTRVVRGLSEIVGSSANAGVGVGWRYPWLIEPNDWRSWWRLRGGGREKVKAAAVALVGCAWPAVGKVLEARGDAGDVAEAILLGVGAARRSTEAPTGPKRAIGGVADVWGRLA